MKNNDITLKRLNYKEQWNVVDIIYSDDKLLETFGGYRNTKSRLINSNYVAFIQKKDKTIGFVMIVNNPKNNANEIDIGIIQRYRNKGYGTQALSILKSLILQNNLLNIKIQIKKENIAAIKSVLNNGFVLLNCDDECNYYTIQEKTKRIK